MDRNYGILSTFNLPSQQSGTVMSSSNNTNAALPPNVHVSQHPCVLAKLSQLRSSSTNSADVQRLVHEIATMVGCEALGNGAVDVVQGETVSSTSLPALSSKPNNTSLTTPIPRSPPSHRSKEE